MAIDVKAVSEAFNSMLRTDYIALSDTEKLRLLGQYYVDYFGYLSQLLAPNDQLIVGRRGTGKTTLLYRVLVECMRSWANDGVHSQAPPRTLAIYIDLSKCHSLSDVSDGTFADFEHVFMTETCDAIGEELNRSWPELAQRPGLFKRMFDSANTRRIEKVREACAELGSVMKSGVQRFIDNSGTIKDRVRESRNDEVSVRGSLKAGSPAVSMSTKQGGTAETEQERHRQVHYRLTVADVLQVLGELRQEAGIPQILLLVDEFSSLNDELQGRFTTLLRKLLGNHVGLYVKLCAITDNYTLGSSIILQRDLFEVSLDLDAYIDRSPSLNAAMAGLSDQAERIVTERLRAYGDLQANEVFEGASDAWRELSRSAMGVPRTIGIVLQHAWSRTATSSSGRIRKSDIEAGIKYAGQTYLKQLIGASKNSVAIPAAAAQVWDQLLDRAMKERTKGGEASHFMLRSDSEIVIRYLTMFFVVHLITRGRTTKKDSTSRNLYCFDYGICIENNLGFATDKNVIRQQRFAYDDEIDNYLPSSIDTEHSRWRCTDCGRVYHEADLQVAGTTLQFCPHDRADLQLEQTSHPRMQFTEEEAKIIGAIRSAGKKDKLLARRIADDVGCYVQKVAKFGEKLNREELIEREKSDEYGRLIYFAEGDETAAS